MSNIISKVESTAVSPREAGTAPKRYTVASSFTLIIPARVTGAFLDAKKPFPARNSLEFRPLNLGSSTAAFLAIDTALPKLSSVFFPVFCTRANSTSPFSVPFAARKYVTPLGSVPFVIPGSDGKTFKS